MLLPPRTWNARISVSALHAAASRASAHHALPLPPHHWLERVFTFIASSARNDAVLVLQALRTEDVEGFADLRALLNADPDLSWLLAACAVSSIAPVALVGEAAREGVVKLSYNEQLQEVTADAFRDDPESENAGLSGLYGRYVSPLLRLARSELGWGGYSMFIDSPFIGASTYHVEVPAPEGMEIYDAGVVEVPEIAGASVAVPHRQRPEYELHLARGSKVSSEVHLYVDNASAKHSAFTWVDLRARRQGFLTGACWASVLVTAVLYAGWRFEDRVTAAPRGVAELLLIFPAVVATYAARPDAHRLTSRRLRGARALLALVALAPYVAAGAYALEPRGDNGRALSDTFATWWFWLAVGSAACTAVLAVARVLPITQLRRQRLLASAGLPYARREVLRSWWRYPWLPKWAPKFIPGRRAPVEQLPPAVAAAPAPAPSRAGGAAPRVAPPAVDQQAATEGPALDERSLTGGEDEPGPTTRSRS